MNSPESGKPIRSASLMMASQSSLEKKPLWFSSQGSRNGDASAFPVTTSSAAMTPPSFASTAAADSKKNDRGVLNDNNMVLLF